MCGIAGLISTRQIDREEVLAMTRCLAHRGPDASDLSILAGGQVALGHTRLSVIDLSASANQPMSSPDGRYSIVFNGEVYNYKTLRKDISLAGRTFVTESDTEVILQGFMQWGSGVCQKMEGMFAFALFDHAAGTLFLCRDRIGKKPLYYFHSGGLFAFASEIKSLLSHPVVRHHNRVDYDAICQFLHLGYIPEPRTSYTSIKKFPSGHFAYVRLDGTMNVSCYHPSPGGWRASPPNPVNAIARTKEALMGAVGKRLVADVPVGAYLSGGTDSSLVVAMASQLSSDRLKTFSIGFQKSQFDETIYAGKVARVLGTDHTECILAEEEAIGILEQYLKHFDEPFADTSAIPSMLVSKLARKDVKVVLTGDGGDELFLGYGMYDWANRLEQPWLRMVQSPLSYALKKLGKNNFKRIGFMLEKVAAPQLRSHIFSQDQYFFARSEIMAMVKRSSPDLMSMNYIDPADAKLRPAEKQALYDLQHYLKDDLLVKVDRASMLYGLECRSPFLDNDVISVALSLQYDMKKRGATRKWVLKEILKEYLPEDLVYRPKWGFSIPLVNWLRNELAYLIDTYLSETMINNIGLVDYVYVKRLKDSFSSGTDFVYNRLWVLIAAHKWLHENGKQD